MPRHPRSSPRTAFAAALTAVATAAAPGRASVPSFAARSANLPTATITGVWSETLLGWRLEIKGAVPRVAPTSFDAAAALPMVGSKRSRCPQLVVNAHTLVRGTPDGQATAGALWRARHPGGRWSAWFRFDEPFLRVGSGVSHDDVNGVLTPDRKCVGPLAYEWRMHGDLAGDVVVGPTTFDVRVQPR